MASSSYEMVDYYWNMIPPGFRFDPKDEELITHYLVPKINGEALPPNKMHDAELYGERAPQDLIPYYEPESENTWYFFTRLERLYENGSRPRRSAGNGYWKMTGKEIPITNKQGNVIGFRRNFAFFIKIEPSLPKQKDEPKGIKTPWLMHEFRVNNVPSTSEPKSKRRKTNYHDGTSPSQGSKPKNMLDGWVLCKVYRLVRDVEVEALNPAHQEEEQHQAIEQPVALNNEANNDLLQRDVVSMVEEQGVEQHVVALNNGANDDLIIPKIEVEYSFEHLHHNQEDNLQYLQRDVTVVEAPNSAHQHLQYYHQGVEQPAALNDLLDYTFQHQQHNQDMPQFSQEDSEFLYNIFPRCD
ncbi:NAC domain-containing protein 67-like [Chenopodium quinoa]|uniref:NAC domain-containing protein n=1 Tax=Chenopodium quinoa TaxID=63459 RepID=A0A803M9R0_CHEQI|nr:NAC domain-containing protein 67-like [Chenopodium quinoa]